MRTKAQKMRRIAARVGACKGALDWLDEYNGPDDVGIILAFVPHERWREWWHALMRVGAIVHPTARVSHRSWVYPGAEIGADCRIGADTVIRYHAIIAPGVRVRDSSVVGNRVVIGEHVEIGEDVLIYPNCRIGEHVVIGEGVRVREAVTVGAGSVIGADCRIADGVTIPPCAQIPDGSIINKGDIL